MKNILAVDTATKIMAVALLKDKKVYGLNINEGFTHSEKLISTIDKLMDEAEIKISDIELLVCTRGPGSFTGLRIGMATLKGISTALNIPLISIPTLDLYASGRSDFDGVVLPVIDARKKSFYTAIFRNGVKDTKDLDLTTEKILNLVKKENNILLTGIDSEMLYNKYTNDNRFILDNRIRENYATELIKLGLQYYKSQGPDNISQGPLYIRKSEAEILLNSKNNK